MTLRRPPDFPGLQVIARGSTSTIYQCPNLPPSLVIKVLDRDHSHKLHAIERSVYERINDHPQRPSSLLAFHGTHASIPYSLILEFASRGNMYDYIFTDLALHRPPDSTYRQWSLAAARALAFLHDQGILHGDIHTTNFFLTTTLQLRLADFGAASLDATEPVLRYRCTHQLYALDPVTRRHEPQISVASDVFALGCALFHMEAGRDAFDFLEDDADREELRRRLVAREMPDVTSLTALGVVIDRCWRLDYKGMDEVRDGLACLVLNADSSQEGAC